MTLMLANFVKFYKLGFNSWAVEKRTFVLFLPTPTPPNNWSTNPEKGNNVRSRPLAQVSLRSSGR